MDTFSATALLVGLVGAGALIATVGVRVTLATGAGVCGVCALAAAATLLGREPKTPPPSTAGLHARTGFVDARLFP
jgi:hypothetical protein